LSSKDEGGGDKQKKPKKDGKLNKVKCGKSWKLIFLSGLLKRLKLINRRLKLCLYSF
jgi:hypothetical protein